MKSRAILLTTLSALLAISLLAFLHRRADPAAEAPLDGTSVERRVTHTTIEAPGDTEGSERDVSTSAPRARRASDLRLRDSNTGRFLGSCAVLALDASGAQLAAATTDPDGWARLPLGVTRIVPADGWSFAPTDASEGGEIVDVDGRFRLRVEGLRGGGAWLFRNATERRMIDLLDRADHAAAEGADPAGELAPLAVELRANVSEHSTSDLPACVVTPDLEITPCHPLWSGSIESTDDGHSTAAMPARADERRGSPLFEPEPGETYTFNVSPLVRRTEVTFLLQAPIEGVARTSLMSIRTADGTSSLIRNVFARQTHAIGESEVVYQDVPPGDYELTSAIQSGETLQLSSHRFTAASGRVLLSEANGRGPYRVKIVECEGWTLLSILSRAGDGGASSNVQLQVDLPAELIVAGIPHQDAKLYFARTGEEVGTPSRVVLDLAADFELSLSGLE